LVNRKRRRATTDQSQINIPGYRDLTLIGHGGYAKVYRAHQERVERVVAIKILRVEIEDEAARRRFRRECQVMGRLSGHPYIVTVHDADVTPDGHPFIAMEYLGGGTLELVGTLPQEEVLRIGVNIASALDAAHDAGVLHRDIKPQNILLSNYGEPRLGDFGLSIIGERLDFNASELALTPLHAPPEVFEGRSAGPASDLYSFGSTLYALLAGRPPFHASGEEGIAPMLLRVLTSDVPDLETEAVTPSLMAILRRLLAKEPTDRPQSARELATLLQDVQQELGLAVTPVVTGAVKATAISSVSPTPNGIGLRRPAQRVDDVLVSPEASTVSRAGGAQPVASTAWAGDPLLQVDAASRGQRRQARHRTRRRTGVAAAALVVALLLLAIALALRSDDRFLNVPTNVRATPANGSTGTGAAWQVSWKGDGGQQYLVLTFVERGGDVVMLAPQQPRLGPRQVVPGLEPGAPYCFFVADVRNSGNDALLPPPGAFSQPWCIGGANPRDFKLELPRNFRLTF
jgi:serine/threonine protein kinase